MTRTAGDRIHTAGTLQPLIESWRGRGERVVFTNGCFDLLHAGHLACLETARAAGDRLVVGVNSDRSVRALKGANRPFVPVSDRAVLVAALAIVDAVVTFDEDTPGDLIRLLRPDVLVKGEEYRDRDLAGAAEVRSWGGEVIFVARLPGRSSTAIVSRIRAATA